MEKEIVKIEMSVRALRMLSGILQSRATSLEPEETIVLVDDETVIKILAI